MPETALIPDLVARGAARAAMQTRARRIAAAVRRADRDARGAAAPTRNAARCLRAGRRLPPLPAARPGDADRVRRRTGTRAWCSSANSRATRKISPANHSSVRPGSCSIARWARPASNAPRLRHQRGQAFQIRAARQAPHPQAPNAGEVTACRWWLERELAGRRSAPCGGAGRHRRRSSRRRRGVGPARARSAGFSRRSRATSPCTRRSCCACPTRRRKATEYARFVADLRRVREMMETAPAAA